MTDMMALNVGSRLADIQQGLRAIAGVIAMAVQTRRGEDLDDAAGCAILAIGSLADSLEAAERDLTKASLA